MDVFENPWDPSTDVFLECLSPEWPIITGKTADPVCYHTMNILGDLSGVEDLIGVLVDVCIPANGSSDSAQVLLIGLSNKTAELTRLVDIMFAEVIQDETALISRASIGRKWNWWPLISKCTDDKSAPKSLANHKPISTSPIVFVLRCLIHTIIEDDIQSRISPWFESNKAYWRLLVGWLEGFYESLGSWQNAHDKRGVWNNPHGKLFRALRPFSTYAPCMSLVITRGGIMDKSGIIRIILYHTMILIRVMRAWGRQIVSGGLRVDDLEVATDNFIRILSSVGITRIGSSQAILWGDKHLQAVPVPPIVEACCLNQNEAIRFGEMKNFIATVAYQRNICLQMLHDSFAFAEIFKVPLDDYIRMNRSIYESIMTVELPPADEQVLAS